MQLNRRAFFGILTIASTTLLPTALAGPFSNVGKGKSDGEKETPAEKPSEKPDSKLTAKETCEKYGHDWGRGGGTAGPYPIPGYPDCFKYLKGKKCKRCFSNGSDVVYVPAFLGAQCPTC